MSAASLLRSVMNESEYDRERQRIAETYGGPDDQDDVVVAKRDMAFADLFYRSGWNQEQLAQREGKTQQWVAYRLRFGRFLAYAENTTTVVFGLPSGLTERRFRGYWERTQKTDDEAARFEEVIRLMQEPESDPEKSKPRKSAPIHDKTREVVAPLVAAGQPVNRKKIAEELDVSEGTVQRADLYERGRQDGLREANESRPVTIGPISKTAKEKLDALEVKLRDRLEKEFADRVSQEVTRHINEYLMPYYKDKLEKAEQLSKFGKPFTRNEYRLILGALHPDNQSKERLREAWELFTSKEALLRPEERDKPFSSDLPSTLEELMARRKVRR